MFRHLPALLVAIVLGFSWSASVAQGAAAPQKDAPGEDLKPESKPERGWFFFEKNKQVKEPEQPIQPNPPSQAQTPAAPKPPENRCKKADTWSPDCGFIDPGTDYDFQAKQRDALLTQMSMSQNDPKAVEQFQYYMRWVMGRASEVANLWAYNMVQNPDLDPAAKRPISTLGIRMMSDVQSGKEAEIFKVIKEEGGMLVFFSRTDCQFCHVMSVSLERFARDAGIPVRNASLDDQCMPNFKEGCLAGEAVQAPAQALQVTTVPSLFLYVKPNTWIRVGTGVVSDDTMRSRIFSFFSAYRTAMLKGVNNAQKGRASVDFSFQDGITGTAAGVAVEKDAKGQAGPVRMPTEDDVAKLLNKN